ncbi:hypothetical protein BC835DRAFT_488950 [Cytidiella melzeri]|nr:hypothetical protein BC835DRAFT_488950 [Cytidiella melzeri]
MVTISAMPQSGREIPLGDPDNSAGLSTGKDATTRGLAANSYGELHLPVNDQSNAAGQQHQTRRSEMVYARNSVPASGLRTRSTEMPFISSLVDLKNAILRDPRMQGNDKHRDGGKHQKDVEAPPQKPNSKVSNAQTADPTGFRIYNPFNS